MPTTMWSAACPFATDTMTHHVSLIHISIHGYIHTHSLCCSLLTTSALSPLMFVHGVQNTPLSPLLCSPRHILQPLLLLQAVLQPLHGSLACLGHWPPQRVGAGVAAPPHAIVHVVNCGSQQSSRFQHANDAAGNLRSVVDCADRYDAEQSIR
jgi:hypothetical protein